MPLLLCRTGSALLAAYSEKSKALVDGANRMSELASGDTDVSKRHRAELATLQNQCNLLLSECKRAYQKLHSHQAEHGC